MPTRVVILVVFSGSSSARGHGRREFPGRVLCQNVLRAYSRIGKGYAKYFPLHKERFVCGNQPVGSRERACAFRVTCLCSSVLFDAQMRCYAVPPGRSRLKRCAHNQIVIAKRREPVPSASPTFAHSDSSGDPAHASWHRSSSARIRILNPHYLVGACFASSVMRTEISSLTAGTY